MLCYSVLKRKLLLSEIFYIPMIGHIIHIVHRTSSILIWTYDIMISHVFSLRSVICVFLNDSCFAACDLKIGLVPEIFNIGVFWVVVHLIIM